MTDTSDTFPADRTDELLSARLDGELDDAIAELAPTEAELDALDGVASTARARSLAAAGAALAPVGPLDDLTRARLVRAAVAAATTPAVDADLTPTGVARRRDRRVVTFGAVAASIALVAGVAFALGGPLDDGADDVAESNTGANESAATDLGALLDLGTVDDPAQLRDRLVDRLGGDSATLPGDAAQPERYDDSAPAVSSTLAASSVSADDGAAAAERADADSLTGAASISDPASCLAHLNPGGPAPTLIGTATFQGIPAFVATIEGATRTQAWVFAGDCTLLNFQSLEQESRR